MTSSKLSKPILYSEALKLLRESALRQAMPTEVLPSTACVGRVVAADTFGEVTLPPYDNSAVDGFCVLASATSGAAPSAPVRFNVLGRIVAGDLPPENCDENNDPKSGVWEIMTGAPFPKGYDASVKIEDVTLIRDGSGGVPQIELKFPVASGENWRGKGKDFLPGTRVVSRGVEILPEHLLALSAVGIDSLCVFRKPRVAVLATGSEIASAGEPLSPGQIRDATGPFLKAALPTLGLEVRHYGRVGDAPEEFMSVMEKILSDGPDIILTTGAVSMGVHDFVTTSVRDLGGEVIFHKVAIRPGKPILFAEFSKGPVLFGMPGNPVSTVVGTRFFLDPFLRERLRRPAEIPARAVLKNKVPKPDGLRCFFKASLTLNEKEGPVVEVLSGQPSFMISPLLQANCWAILPEMGQEVSEGTGIEVFSLMPFAYPWGEK